MKCNSNESATKLEEKIEATEKIQRAAESGESNVRNHQKGQEPIDTEAKTTSEQLPADLSESQKYKQTPEYRKLFYQRDISINTALEPMYSKSHKANKPEISEYKSPSSQNNEKSPNSIPTSKAIQKNFLFSDQIFDPKSPASPHRSLMFGHFVKDRIGEEKFEKLKHFFANSNDPMKILQDQPKLIIDIIGEEHKECLVFLKYMISSSITPKISESKSSVFDQVKSPISRKNNSDHTPSNTSQQQHNPTFSEIKLKPVEVEEEKFQ